MRPFSVGYSATANKSFEQLLLPLTRNKPSKSITPEMDKQLESRLDKRENPSSSYEEVEQWLLDPFLILNS